MRHSPNISGIRVQNIGPSIISRLREVFDNLTRAGGDAGRFGRMVSRTDVETAINEAGREEVASWLEQHGYGRSDNIDPLWVLQAASEVNLQRLMQTKNAMVPDEGPLATKALQR